MDINKALAHEGPALRCRENGAEIAIETGRGGVKTYTPSVPDGTPELTREAFAALYHAKHFEVVEPDKASKSKATTDNKKES